MGTLKESILAAEWAGYRWALQHLDATADEVEDACIAYLPEHMSGVFAYAFERGWAMAHEGKAPQAIHSDAPRYRDLIMGGVPGLSAREG